MVVWAELICSLFGSLLFEWKCCLLHKNIAETSQATNWCPEHWGHFSVTGWTVKKQFHVTKTSNFPEKCFTLSFCQNSNSKSKKINKKSKCDRSSVNREKQISCHSMSNSCSLKFNPYNNFGPCCSVLDLKKRQIWHLDWLETPTELLLLETSLFTAQPLRQTAITVPSNSLHLTQECVGTVRKNS